MLKYTILSSYHNESFALRHRTEIDQILIQKQLPILQIPDYEHNPTGPILEGISVGHLLSSKYTTRCHRS
jgi:hypothetical protein